MCHGICRITFPDISLFPVFLPPVSRKTMVK
ncbi:hypothetical protein [Clostridium phage Saumur]|nr:hypothetical protein [Clostridium phage Saumur]